MVLAKTLLCALIMVKTQVEQELVYSPSSLVGIFANTLNNEATRKLFSIKGVYVEGKGNAYSGYYYDTLRDESSDAFMTIVVPAFLRANLKPNKTIQCIGYLTKKVQSLGARVELQVNITEVVSQAESRYTEDQVRGFELLQKKAEAGYKDVDSLIRNKIAIGEPVVITILYGKNAVVDTDIKHQLQGSMGCYKIHFREVNLSSQQSIIENLQVYSQKSDIIAIARGGGSGLEIFDKPEVIEAALTLEVPLITAIGHEQDVTLLQKVADKAFITPTALGQYLSDIYNKTIEQVQDTKAKLVNDISKQFKANYEHQIETLYKQVESLKELNKHSLENTIQVNQKEVGLLQSQVEELKQQHRLKVIEVEGLQKKVKSSASIVLMLVLLVVAIILGIMLGQNL
jgi:exodeoxyribonuclease VII large subunit